MITCYVMLTTDGRARELGKHSFAAAPHAGDELLLYHGENIRATVRSILHNSRPQDGSGPEGAPTITVFATR